jgi:hypothetical protein
MRSIIVGLFLIWTFSSCSTGKLIPLKGQYPATPIVIDSPNSFEKTWDRLVDLFAQKGLAIKIIDKSSGLIVSENSRMPATIEDKNGKVYDPTAFIVIPVRRIGSELIPVSGKTSGPYAKKIKANDVFGEWNVRIKPNGTGSTINVNITNVSYEDYLTATKSYHPVSIYDYKSTGVFENQIAELIK